MGDLLELHEMIAKRDKEITKLKGIRGTVSPEYMVKQLTKQVQSLEARLEFYKQLDKENPIIYSFEEIKYEPKKKGQKIGKKDKANVLGLYITERRNSYTNKKIQSLEAQLKNAREKNRKQNLLLGKAQKRTSKVCAVKLTNQNKHLREQLKKTAQRYEELKAVPIQRTIVIKTPKGFPRIKG